MVEIADVIVELRAEGAFIEAMVRDLVADEWTNPTPAEGWTIAHQVGHLHWTDAVSSLAIDHLHEFNAVRERHACDPDQYVDDAAAVELGTGPADLLHRWTMHRDALSTRLAELPPATSIEWFGPPMKPASMATARLMETWAHGQDIADALHIEHPAGSALRHIAHLGVRTRNFSFELRGLPAPTTEIFVDLTAPDGSSWQWGPPNAPESVSGQAEDFCLAVTQRRHTADLELDVRGETAQLWLSIAQAFAGKATSGRAPSGHSQ
ncbi:TIGR03084 family protein [Rhodococcus globerulus]|nr:TIGR03084 family protein [Rhodococcus globerulus]